MENRDEAIMVLGDKYTRWTYDDPNNGELDLLS
jgi:hypothetical protein